MIPTKFILCIIFLKTSLSSVRNYNDVNLVDDAHFYPHAGVYLEPAGQYLQYSGSIAIPFVYTLPSLKVHHNKTYCPGHESIWKTYNTILNHIHNIVSPKTSHSRINKRSFLPIASLIAGGLGVWNTIELQGIKNNLQWMNKNAIHINRAISEITDSQHILIHNVESLIGIVGDHARIINNLINKTYCDESSETEFRSLVLQWLYYAPSEFISAYSGAVTGKLTPEMLSARNLKVVLSTHIEMKDTIYEMEPETAYELGQVILTEVIVDAGAFLKGIIQLPKILAISPTPMYNVYTVNVIKDSYEYKYIFPSMLICSNPKSCWDVDHTMCIRKSYRLICLYGTKSIFNDCINDLHQNQSSTCKLSIRKHYSDEAVQTKSGILIGGTSTDYQMYHRKGDIDTRASLVRKSPIPRLLQGQDGDWLTLNGSIYSTKIIGFDYNFSIYLTPYDFDNSAINPVSVTHEWKPMEAVHFKPLSYESYQPYFIIFLIAINMLLCIGLVVLGWHILIRTKTDKGKIIEPNIPLIGLR